MTTPEERRAFRLDLLAAIALTGIFILCAAGLIIAGA